MTPDEAEARLYADERKTLHAADMDLARWERRLIDLSVAEIEDGLMVSPVEWQAMLFAFRQVLEIARAYHIGAEDLVG